MMLASARTTDFAFLRTYTRPSTMPRSKGAFFRTLLVVGAPHSPTP